MSNRFALFYKIILTNNCWAQTPFKVKSLLVNLKVRRTPYEPDDVKQGNRSHPVKMMISWLSKHWEQLGCCPHSTGFFYKVFPQEILKPCISCVLFQHTLINQVGTAEICE